jgi:hypothetical protein
MFRTALVAGLALAAGCTKKIDSGKAERLLVERLGGKVKVTCPTDIPIKKGTKFTCQVAQEAKDEPPFTVEVTMDDDEGNVTWSLQPIGMFDGVRDVEAFSTAQKAKVKCAKRFTLMKTKGETLTCDATVGEKESEQKKKLLVTFANEPGKTFTFELKD